MGVEPRESVCEVVGVEPQVRGRSWGGVTGDVMGMEPKVKGL